MILWEGNNLPFFMNVFCTSPSPWHSAQVLPDKHIVKMPLECCQMLAIVYSHWYYNWGEIHKSNGEQYSTKKGAFRNHPCTKWAAESMYNTAWLIAHGTALCTEYHQRYDKIHSCAKTLFEAKKMFHRYTGETILCYNMVESFTRAMPDEFKLDTSISTFDAYKMYVSSKPWVKDNYLRLPDRKPEWV